MLVACQCEIDAAEAERVQRETEARQRRIAALYKESGMGARFRECTFDNFKVSDGSKKALVSSKKYVENWIEYRDKGMGVVLHGGTGNGKTHLAAAVANHLLQRGAAVAFANVPELLGRIKFTFNGGSEKAENIMRYLVEADLTVLDDLGAERHTEWVEETLYYIINSRYVNQRPLYITTNLAPDKLGSSVGERTLSRINHCCHFIENKAGDFRRVGK